MQECHGCKDKYPRSKLPGNNNVWMHSYHGYGADGIFPCTNPPIDLVPDTSPMPITQKVKTEYRICWEFNDSGVWKPQIMDGRSHSSPPFSSLEEVSKRANDLLFTTIRRNIRVESRTITTMSSDWSPVSRNPLDALAFPVKCHYPDCGAGPFNNSVEVDEHITEEHLPQAIWTFALEQMRNVNPL